MSNLNLTKMIWTQTKQFGHDQKDLYPSKTIWTVQNHFGSIEGQGILLLHSVRNVELPLTEPSLFCSTVAYFVG